MIIIIISTFLLGTVYGGITVADHYQYKLDRCIETRLEYQIDRDECQEDLTLCQLRCQK